MIEAHTKHLQKVNIWAGFVATNVIRHLIIDGNLTGNFYYKLLFDTKAPQTQSIDGSNKME